MNQSTLAEILDVEKGIRAELDAEREKAGRWLEDAQREIERAHQDALAGLQAEAGRRRESVLHAAREEAAGIIQRAGQAASRQALLSDDQLRAVLRRRIARILPEQAR
jgi:vacuolar-type H+-ATPase subunit H